MYLQNFLTLILSCLIFQTKCWEYERICSPVYDRSDWNADPPKQKPANLSVIPPTFVVVHHSETPTCVNYRTYGLEYCPIRIKRIQLDHIKTNGWDDIGYNFLIGGDGSIFEGRGWGVQGAHHPKFNTRSIGICLIGNFKYREPPTSQLLGLENLIACGVKNKTISSDYHLIGHRQGRDTDCPGNEFFRNIQRMPHFDPDPQ